MIMAITTESLLRLMDYYTCPNLVFQSKELQTEPYHRNGLDCILFPLHSYSIMILIIWYWYYLEYLVKKIITCDILFPRI